MNRYNIIHCTFNKSINCATQTLILTPASNLTLILSLILTLNLFMAQFINCVKLQSAPNNRSSLPQAANYLDIKGLLDILCRTIADIIKGKNPDEIRRTFNVADSGVHTPSPSPSPSPSPAHAHTHTQAQPAQQQQQELNRHRETAV